MQFEVNINNYLHDKTDLCTITHTENGWTFSCGAWQERSANRSMDQLTGMLQTQQYIHNLVDFGDYFKKLWVAITNATITQERAQDFINEIFRWIHRSWETRPLLDEDS
ncbi:hypothetical protein [Pseudoalteromonas sp. T1lg10]|uniref:hypothetical protein n=1 Tax=Pseudoalteromonas sp. T1lg10 TaxID=2077093 RepID=UPI000CF5F456|nr:hypothetical protein [Pseudoalteromonas sp. T1lg10]